MKTHEDTYVTHHIMSKGRVTKWLNPGDNICQCYTKRLKYRYSMKRSMFGKLCKGVIIKHFLFVKRYILTVLAGHCLNPELHKKSSKKFYHKDYKSAQALAADGFVHTGKKGVSPASCVRCKTVMQDTGWSIDMNAKPSHRKPPNCPEVTPESSKNLAFKSTMSADVEELDCKLNTLDLNSPEGCPQATVCAASFIVTAEAVDTEATGKVHVDGCAKEQATVSCAPKCTGEPTNAGNVNQIKAPRIVERINLHNLGITPKKSANQQYGEALTNVPTGEIYLNVVTASPKFNDFSDISNRFNSFKRCPGVCEFYIHKNELSDVGFFHTEAAPSSDGHCGAICFYCGLELRSPEQHCWADHARLNVSCPYVLLKKGKGFVDSVQAANDAFYKVDISLEDQNKELKDAAVLALLKDGFPQDKVLKAADTLQRAGQKLSADTLLQQVTGQDLELSEEAQTLKQENVQLRSLQECKQCNRSPVEVVFLACGHFVACADCAILQKVKHNKCNECGRTINGLVRVSICPMVEQSPKNV